jgi:CO/xanthine dehydrogenase FAD-binding subunit
MYNPSNLQALCEILRQYGHKAVKIAGGTDLILSLKGSNPPDSQAILLNLLAVPELNVIEETTERVFIGSTITHRHLAADKIIAQHGLALAQAAGGIGSQQIRNRGTLGGNLANASTAADLLPVLFGLNAKVHLLDSRENAAEVAVSDFVVGKNQTVLKAEQIITGISFAKARLGKTAVSGFQKLGSRKEVTIALISAMYHFVLDANGIIEEASLYVGAINQVPVTFEPVNQLFLGHKPAAIGKDIIHETYAIISTYINEFTPAEFARDYKKFALKGVLTDLLL